jgi:hypothetical protein
LDAQGQVVTSTLHEDRIMLRRLFIGPGFDRHHVQVSKGITTKQSPVTRYADPRTPILMQLDAGVVTQIAAQKSGYDFAVAAEALRHVVEEMRITTIRFVNLRQNNWYTPSEGGGAADHFDLRQIAMTLGLLIFVLQPRSTYKTGFYPIASPNDEFPLWTGAGDDPHRPATIWDNSEEAIHPDIGDRAETSYYPSTNHSRLWRQHALLPSFRAGHRKWNLSVAEHNVSSQIILHSPPSLIVCRTAPDLSWSWSKRYPEIAK